MGRINLPSEARMLGFWLPVCAIWIVVFGLSWVLGLDWKLAVALAYGLVSILVWLWYTCTANGSAAYADSTGESQHE